MKWSEFIAILLVFLRFANENNTVYWLNQLYAKYYFTFLGTELPGIEANGLAGEIVKLLSSKNPDTLIIAKATSSNGSVGELPKNIFVFANSSRTSQKPRNQDLSFDLLLDPALKADQTNRSNQSIHRYKLLFDKLNKTASLPFLFSSLWYSTMPCFDVKGVTSDRASQNSLLKLCQWKGRTMPCSAIFTTFPTDKGMCCTFNMKAAEDIFRGKIYSELVASRQKEDNFSTFGNISDAAWYFSQKEPKSISGIAKGLYVMLDAHYDLVEDGSVDSDFWGFTGLIHESGSYPLISQNGFLIRPGHNNFIALSATKIDADESLRNIQPQQRNCLFSDENLSLKIHKKYSQTNCLLECFLLKAQSMLSKQANTTSKCTPWFFPFDDDSVRICDPWETKRFYEIMIFEVPSDACGHCLADCSKTMYQV